MYVKGVKQMAITFKQESALESRLLTQLTQGESQWTYRPELTSEEDLWENFRQKLENNNKAILDGETLSEAEFNQVKNALNFPNPYQAALWLRGENGVAKVRVQRDDVKKGNAYLTVINSQEIAGGRSSYEVINQYCAKKANVQDRNRRFDVTLLINGLPMIHIELKNASTSYFQAFNQIKKYQAEGKFSGIFSTVQMFVVSNSVDTRYIAAANGDKLKPTFLTNWVDKNNEPIDNYLDFARHVLSIPQAHKMLTQYSVLDNASKSLILLRPYQIHAIEAIKEASKRRESGYVWHTTGSGKTLTSYRAAGNLYDIASVDKVLFMVDRVDLDQQTTGAFESYAEFEQTDIDATNNVSDLIRKLSNQDRNVIVTTRQKMDYLMRRLNVDQKARQNIENKRLVFVVDEAHRAVSPQKQDEINRFFKYNTMWYGFTGTPIFAENAREEFGDLARTTQEQYGQLLHQYTVKEAIHDQNVLGFQVHYMEALDEFEIDHLLSQKNPNLPLDDMEIAEKESRLPAEIYDREEFMWQVVDRIVNHSGHLFNVKRGAGRSYSALLTTTSIAQAQRYYELFREVRQGSGPVSVREGIKRYLPDFPKVAITYSLSENEEASHRHQEKMKQAIADYNDMFKTNLSIENIAAYNRNLNERLARKATQYQSRRGEQLDLVIVVDRLLTGFDAPTLSTLFIDRPPMPPHNMIQAFSRTNRLYDRDKKYGQIVLMRTPEYWRNCVREALILYSNGGENEILAPTWTESLNRFEEALGQLRAIAPEPDVALEQMEDVDLKHFVKAFQEFDKALTAIQVYDEYSEKAFIEAYQLDGEDLEIYHGKYKNALELIREDDAGEEEMDIDIEYQLQSVHVSEINYEYIIHLLQSYVPQTESEDVKAMTGEEQDELRHYIDEMRKSKPELANLTENIFLKLVEDPQAFEGQDIKLLIENLAYQHQEKALTQFAENYAVDYDALHYYASQFIPNTEIDQDFDIRGNTNYQKFKEQASKKVNKLQYIRLVRNEMDKMIAEEVYPYRI